jgi:hypothetical protein
MMAHRNHSQRSPCLMCATSNSISVAAAARFLPVTLYCQEAMTRWASARWCSEMMGAASRTLRSRTAAMLACIQRD